MLLKNCLFLAAKSIFWLSIVLLNKPLIAQVDVTVTVDGPWAYVADPDHPQNRIIVIAPAAPNHDTAEVKPKPSGHKNHIPTGSYNLKVDNLSNCDGTTSTTSFYPLSNITLDAIRNAIAWKDNRYAFNLPKPCYYKQVYRNVEKISTTAITTSADDVVGDSYTTTTELHYMVNPLTAARLTGKSDDGSTIYDDDIDFQDNDIQFIMSAGLLSSNDESACDSTSAASFLASVKLFGERRYVWFPMLNTLGNQIGDPNKGNKGFFQENCQKDNVRDNLLMNMRTASAALEDIEIIKHYATHAAAANQGVVLHALAGLSNAIDSLKMAPSLPKKRGAPTRPEINVVQEELRSAKDLILMLTDKAPERSSKDRVALQENTGERRLLLNTYRYVMFSAAGSADCHGAQVGVNGP